MKKTTTCTAVLPHGELTQILRKHTGAPSDAEFVFHGKFHRGQGTAFEEFSFKLAHVERLVVSWEVEEEKEVKLR